MPWKEAIYKIAEENNLSVREKNNIIYISKKRDVGAGIALLIAGIILLGICGLVYLIGQYIKRRLKKINPQHASVQKVTGGDVTVAILVVVIMLVGLISIKLAPQSIIGSYLSNLLSTWYGWLIIPIAFYIIGVLGVLVSKLIQSTK